MARDEPFLEGRWETPVGLVRFAYVSSVMAVRQALDEGWRPLPETAGAPRMAIVHPVLGDRPVGPGQAHHLSFHFEDADPIGPTVDLGNGEYAQAFREREGPVEGMLTVTVAGVSTDPIAVRSSPTGPPISSGAWALLSGLVVAQITWLLVVRPRRSDGVATPPHDGHST